MSRPCPLVACLAIVCPLAAQVPDWHQLPAPTQATRRLAFDSARERMVMFESSGPGEVSRTWEWVGDDWSLRRPLHTPPPRSDFAMAYDPLRRRIVLFGGRTAYAWPQLPYVLTDTWEYDGIDWVQRFPLNSPAPQVASSMVFDYATNQIMLAGGSIYGPVWGMWLFDGTTWSAAPPPPGSVLLASDPVRQRVVACSSYSPSTISTYEWDGIAWTQMAPANQPPPRQFEQITYVAQRGTVVMHGGAWTSTGYPTDMWEWDGVNWSAIPGTAPIRSSHSLAHDPVRNRMFVVGGYGQSRNADTQQWDGLNWHGSNPTPWVANMHSAYFDFNRLRVVAFPDYSNANVAFECDGAHWRELALPAAMVGTVDAAFDALRQQAVFVCNSITYEWDGVNWTTASTAPPFLVVAWDSGRSRVVGYDGSALLQWNGVTWTQMATAPAGHQRIVYDTARDEIVLAGGPMLSTWDGVAWTSHPMPAPSRWDYGLGYDEVRQRVVLFGGHAYGTPPIGGIYVHFNDTWQWDGSSWTQLAVAHAPAPQAYPCLVFDYAQQRLLVLGGNLSTYTGGLVPFADVWALDAVPPATVTTLGSGCWGALPAPELIASQPHPGAQSFSIDVQSAPPIAPCLFALAVTPGNLPLGGGCTLFVPNPDALRLGLTNAAGFASAAASIPLALQGFTFAAQEVVLDATTPLGLSFTAGLSITVGW